MLCDTLLFALRKCHCHVMRRKVFSPSFFSSPVPLEQKPFWNARYLCCLNEASVEKCIFPALLPSASIFVNKLLGVLDKKDFGLMACGLNRLELPVDFCNKIYAVWMLGYYLLINSLKFLERETCNKGVYIWLQKWMEGEVKSWWWMILLIWSEMRRNVPL